MFSFRAFLQRLSCLGLVAAGALGCSPPHSGPVRSAESPALGSTHRNLDSSISRQTTMSSSRTRAARRWNSPTTPHDIRATRAARSRLHRKLRALAERPAFALGHEDTTAYGVGWQDGSNRSDVKSICGSHVGVYGWDIFGLEAGRLKNGDGVNFARMQELIRRAYESGGINTISWHVDNPLTGGDAWDRTPAVTSVLPGGKSNGLFVEYLDRVAEYLDSLRGPGNERIPVVLRLFHEHTGDWFWWGRQNAEEDYVRLYRFAIDYLKVERGLDNLLLAFSPDGGRVFSRDELLYGYPGKEYVDVFGLDYYFEPGPSRFSELLGWLVEVAQAEGKIPAITEFGPRGGVNGKGIESDWLLAEFLEPLMGTSHGLKIAYALAWRNARPDHAYYPYPGHPAEKTLKNVCENSAVLLTRDLPVVTRKAL